MSTAHPVTVNDRMQRGYHYERTEPAGRNFDPRFEPELTPKEMLHLGVFGGKYMTDCRDEFPASWFEGAKLSPGGADPDCNFFGIIASKPLGEWRRKGWLHPDDPRGWFQWYCRYYSGRRHQDDHRQIGRWFGDPHAADSIDEHVLVECGNRRMPVQHRQQHCQPVLFQADRESACIRHM